jgi:hypothetical protein
MRSLPSTPFPCLDQFSVSTSVLDLILLGITIANVLSINFIYMDYHLTYSVCQTVFKSVYETVAHYGRVCSLNAMHQEERTKGSCCVFPEQMPF